LNNDIQAETYIKINSIEIPPPPPKKKKKKQEIMKNVNFFIVKLLGLSLYEKYA